MGTPKATLELDHETLADRAARTLREVCDPVVEVGPGYSALTAVHEQPPGRGPLAALVAGADAVHPAGPVVLLACDLLFAGGLVARVATWPGEGTVVPVDADGFPQLVCARYSAAAVERARELVASGERSLRALLDAGDITTFADVDARELVDVDTPEEAARWGVRRPGSLGA
jgi:molybdopterin-guanine dinucleotide biosynthesis protein A